MSRQQQPPRAKCDQVVYEAIAKAAEIIVRGRCQVSSSTTTTHSSHISSSVGTAHARHATTTGVHSRRMGGSGSGVSSRFNLQIEEVDAVRSILQLWKKSLHVPLRLDVYYQYCSSPQDQIPKKELLERWNIDYLSSEQSSSIATSSHISYSSSVNGNTSMHTNRTPNNTTVDDTITQLRQVCKRVVIFLRTLYSLTRMMPAYRLHHALTEDQIHVEGGGPGLGGGYYHKLNPKMQGQVAGNGASNPQSVVHPNRVLEQIGGQILFSFYVSDTCGGGGPSLAPDAALFSSSSNTPFARHDLSPIPTPFGLLHFSALYDSTLVVEKVLLDRAYRLAKYRNTQHPAQYGVTRAIPIHPAPSDVSIPTQDNNQHKRPQPHQQEQHHENDNQKQALPLSAPTNNGIVSRSPNVVSDHIIQNYAMKKNQESFLPRRDSDPIAPRVLSGLSLALMDNDSSDNITTSSEKEDYNASSPLRANSADEAASLRQRVALHHPPPFLADKSISHSTSHSPKQHIFAANTTGIAVSGQQHPYYGYAYNNGKVGIPSPSTPMLIGTSSNSATPQAGSSPKPNNSWTNTPPQPVFIGSLPRGGVGTPGLGKVASDGVDNNNPSSSKSVNSGGGLISPPFQNPLSLQHAPSFGTSVRVEGAVGVGFSEVVENNSVPIQQTQQTFRPNSNTATEKDLILPPVTSADTLEPSPFSKGPMGSGIIPNGSIVSSPTIGRGFAGAGLTEDSSPFLAAYVSTAALNSRSNNINGGSEFMLRSGGASEGISDSLNYDPSTAHDDGMEDMPFAVDMDLPQQPSGSETLDGGDIASGNSTPKISRHNSSIELGSSTGTSSSRVVTSFAHQLASGGRLKLFSSADGNSDNLKPAKTKSTTIDGTRSNEFISDESVSSLSHQLADFRSFGESFNISSSTRVSKSNLRRSSVTAPIET